METTRQSVSNMYQSLLNCDVNHHCFNNYNNPFTTVKLDPDFIDRMNALNDAKIAVDLSIIDHHMETMNLNIDAT